MHSRSAPRSRPAAAATSSGGSNWTISPSARSRSLPTSGGTWRHAPKAAATPAGAGGGGAAGGAIARLQLSRWARPCASGGRRFEISAFQAK